MCDVETIGSDMKVALFSFVIGFISVLLTSGYGQSLQEYPIYEDFENDEALEDPMTEPDYDGMNIPIVKRFGSFFDQRARERYLMGKSPSPPARSVAEPAKIYGPCQIRNRETTLMELIQLCRNDGDDGFEDYGFVNVPGKRFGSLVQQQARTNTFLKTPKYKLKQKRNLNKLKKILMECLVEKNILEANHIKVKKPSNQFLRFGK